MVRRRDRFRAWLKPESASASAVVSPAPSRGSSPAPPPPLSSPPSPPVSSATSLVATTSQRLVLDKAFTKALEKIPESEKAAFAQASKNINERELLTRVHAYDAAHKNTSSFRPHADNLSKFLDLLNRFMGGVAIGIQASPEISSLVVGSVRIVIDLALKFTLYFGRLTDMICAFKDYLKPLAQYSKAADIEIVETTVVSAYATLIDFSWKARRVFIDAAGTERKWTSLRVFMRQHWEPFESEFVAIKEDMRRHFEELSHCVQALHFDFARKAELERQGDEKRREKTAFLNWVSNIDFEKTHQDTFSKKHEDTCDWLIQQPKYQQWLNTSASSLLWCHGKPGIGKSVLASNVIEDITLRVGLREDAALCFAYYNYRNTQLKNLHEIVGSLIKQICRRRDSMPRDLLQFQQDAFPPSLVGTQERFMSLIEHLSEVYVVFDALDECPEQERGDVLEFITGLMTAQGCKIRVFVTSREEMDIENAFAHESLPSIRILAENVTADIETFTRSRVRRLRAGAYGKSLYINDDKLEEKIIQTLASKATGMFLWVNLQLNSLCQASKAHNDAVVEAALKALPQGLPDTYARILDKIEAQTPYMRELAVSCLAWTLYSKSPLRIKELQAALAIDLRRHTSTNDLQMDSPQVILEACGNLLEEANNLIQPIHYTVQEYLATPVQIRLQHTMRAQLLDVRAIHSRLSLTCLRYIQHTAFEQPARTTQRLYRRTRNSPFARYAFRTFDYHLRECGNPSPELLSEVEAILQQESAYLAAIMQIRSSDLEYRKSSVTPSTIVYSSYLYNIPSIRQKWSDEIPPEHALHLATSSGLSSAVARLLEAGHDINEKDDKDRTALYLACEGGNIEITTILIHKKAYIDMSCGARGYALQAASYAGQEQIVRLLLNSGADVNAQGGHFGNALQAASYAGHEQIAKILLNSRADVNAQGGYYGNALQAASYAGHEQIVKVLLGSGADVNAQGGEYGNALQAASADGFEDIVRVLLAAGAEVNAQGGHHGSALQAASFRAHEQLVQMLLAAGADVNAQGGHHGSALHAASDWGCKEVVKILIAGGADVNAENQEHHSALRVASRVGHEQVVQILLDAGARDDRGSSDEERWLSDGETSSSDESSDEEISPDTAL